MGVGGVGVGVKGVELSVGGIVESEGIGLMVASSGASMEGDTKSRT